MLFIFVFIFIFCTYVSQYIYSFCTCYIHLFIISTNILQKKHKYYWYIQKGIKIFEGGERGRGFIAILYALFLLTKRDGAFRILIFVLHYPQLRRPFRASHVREFRPLNRWRILAILLRPKVCAGTMRM